MTTFSILVEVPTTADADGSKTVKITLRKKSGLTFPLTQVVLARVNSEKEIEILTDGLTEYGFQLIELAILECL